MNWIKTKDDGKTAVWQEKEYKFNAPHHFHVCQSGLDYNDTTLDFEMLSSVHFQEGPINDSGINGVTNEDLIHIVMARLEGFQASEFRCRENALALTKLEEALMWLNRRTQKRIERGVEGTHVK